MQNRKAIAHTELRATPAQEAFLKEMENFPWQGSLPDDHVSLVKEMIARLKTEKKRRMCFFLF